MKALDKAVKLMDKNERLMNTRTGVTVGYIIGKNLVKDIYGNVYEVSDNVKSLHKLNVRLNSR